MIRFLAELALRANAKILPSPAPDFSRTVPFPPINGQHIVTGIYCIDMSPPPSGTYWTAWGGSYNEYTGTQIELYYGQFLTHAGTVQDMLATPYSLFIDTATHMVYLNLPKHPWLYPDYSAEGEEVVPFLSSALDPANPPRNTVRGVPAQTRLEIPDFTVKLSDGISGVILNQAFDIVLHNDDGYFDDDSKWDLFNTPVHLKRAVAENPRYEDFREIRGGNAGSTSTSFQEFRINVQDKLRGMEEPVCDVIRQSGFPSFPLLDSAEGKNIPVVYGKKKLKPLKIWEQKDSGGNTTAARYLLAEYASSCTAYDKDGNLMGTTDTADLVLESSMVLYNKTLNGGKLVEVNTALVTGYAPNTIGAVIVDIISHKTGIVYNQSNWDTAEAGAYTASSAPVDIAFTSGNVKKAVADALSSDMAYFIQKQDGRFTLRGYGQTYGEHTVPAWALTRKPEKNFDASQENWFSSCLVKYAFTETGRDTFLSCFYGDLENAAEDRYRKKVFREYETDLTEEADALALARLLGRRYAVMRQRIKIALGTDTHGMDLLDTVYMDLTINGRKFSAAKKFVITEINPAQDMLTLEEAE